MSQQDDELFAREMQGVRRLPDSAAPVAPVRRGPSLSQLARRQAADQQTHSPRELLTLPEQVAEVGVQEGVYRKLRLGKYDPQSRLDLHRVTLRDARIQVISFLSDAHTHGLRTLLITHGKGYHSVTPGRLKSYVAHWLEEWDLVLAYHSAKPWHGGAGATYVLIRKAPEASLRNRELFTQGR
jgi:DNA-nicking Smr family endonuclease